jgi:heat shock protein HslJ
MFIMKRAKLIIAASMAACMVACCPCRKHKSVDKTATPLTGTEWRLTRLGGEALSADTGYSIQFSADGTVSGVGACNRFSGAYTATQERKLTLGDNLVSTRMFCLQQELEDRYMAMLRRADSYAIDGKTLVLLSGGDVLSVFTAARN